MFVINTYVFHNLSVKLYLKYNLILEITVLDFIFFHQQPMKQFQTFLDARKVPYESDIEFQKSIGEAGFTVSISDDYELDFIAEIEAYYDEMMDLNEELVSAEEGDAEIKNAGISVNLSDGSVVLADVNPDLIYKLSTALTPDEIMELVSAIADAVENPDSRPLCKR